MPKKLYLFIIFFKKLFVIVSAVYFIKHEQMYTEIPEAIKERAKQLVFTIPGSAATCPMTLDIPSQNALQKLSNKYCYDPKISKLSANTNHSKSLNFLRCKKEINQGHSDIMNKETKWFNNENN